MKRISIILILLSFYNCFTVYNGNKEVLKSELKESKKESEIKDIYIIKHNLNSKGLTIFMEGYKVNEETTILNFEEYYKVNKNFKWSEEAERIFEGQYKDARGAIGAAAMGLIVLAIELPTLPVRLIPEEESQERQETKKKITSHLEKLNNNGMIFDIGDKEFIATGIFQNNKTFIPIKDLKIHSENYQKIYYKLSNSKEEILVMGEINFSKEVSNSSKLGKIVEANTIKRKKNSCYSNYPQLKKKKESISENSSNEFKECYYLTYDELHK